MRAHAFDNAEINRRVVARVRALIADDNREGKRLSITHFQPGMVQMRVLAKLRAEGPQHPAALSGHGRNSTLVGILAGLAVRCLIDIDEAGRWYALDTRYNSAERQESAA